MNLDSTMTAEMIADILRAKEERGDPGIKMADFLYSFICLKYTTTTLQMEFSYNLVDGIDRFKVHITYHAYSIQNMQHIFFCQRISRMLPCSEMSSIRI